MKTWNKQLVLQWVQQRDPSLLDDKEDLETFTNAGISGSVLLDFDYDFFNINCRLTPGISGKLKQF